MSKSTLFLNNITAIDHAYIDATGAIIGGSVNPTMHVTGEVDEAEKVVVDFSTVKKSLKHIIDAKYSGFDHKLWIIEGFSNCTVEESGRANLSIVTPQLTINAPRDAFKFIKTPFHLAEDGTPNFESAVVDQMEQELMSELAVLHPNVGIHISLDFDEAFYCNPRMDTRAVPFRYTHGLKSSTSWGCQNIAHGHLSFLAAATDNVEATEALLSYIADDIDGTIFIRKENIIQLTNDSLMIGYKTDRGDFNMTITGDYAFAKVIGLETETTVEFLAEAIADQYREALREAGVRQLFVSEGLNKGAVADI